MPRRRPRVLPAVQAPMWEVPNPRDSPLFNHGQPKPTCDRCGAVTVGVPVVVGYAWREERVWLCGGCVDGLKGWLARQ